MKNRSESYRTKQHLIQTQIQVASNNIKYAYIQSLAIIVKLGVKKSMDFEAKVSAVSASLLYS